MTEIKLPSVRGSSQSSVYHSNKRQSFSLEWFYNLPIKGKQLTGLFTSEVISLIGLVGVGAVLIVASGRTQLVRQAEAELAVAATNYNIKIDQMSVGFRSQSDNASVISAAIAHSKDEPLTPELQTQVKQILQNEIKANNIEYATLVGKDLRIIVNGNNNRSGETFNPNSLVSEVFKNAKQIQASQIISWNDLAKESPSLPQGFAKQDALIRYTVTPVKDSKTGSVVGALVAGDIVNGKLPIVENTLRAFGGGYSAIYNRQSSGNFTLATALDQGKAANLKPVQPGVPLLDTSLLEKATASPGKIVTGRAVAGTQSYTMATKAITDFSGKPVAVLVRGTSETALNRLLGESLLLQVVISSLTLAVDVALAILLGRTITQPIKQLQQTARNFTHGDRKARAKVLTSDEVGHLAQTFNELADSIVSSEVTLAEQARRQLAEADRLRSFSTIGTVADFFNSIIENLREIVMQVKLASAQVNCSLGEDEQAVKQLSFAALKQADEISRALDSIEQMTYSIQVVAENANQAAVVARNASIAAEAGGTAMDGTVENIVTLQETVVKTANKVRDLGESSKQIAKVVSWIQEITLQTNLLALNASIEASRAGEDGLGFRVVAENIAELATQAANATREIEEVIKSIELGTKEVVEAMEESKTQVVDGTHRVIDAKRNLEKIFEVSRQIDELVQSISSATVSQAQTSQIVTELMQDIAKTSQQTSDSSRKVSNSLRQTVEVAEKLQMSVGRFKISTEKTMNRSKV